MKIFINQSERVVDEGLSLVDLLASEGIKPEGIAVAIDNRIISRDMWATTLLTEGAKVIVIQATYGG